MNERPLGQHIHATIYDQIYASFFLQTSNFQTPSAQDSIRTPHQKQTKQNKRNNNPGAWVLGIFTVFNSGPQNIFTESTRFSGDMGGWEGFGWVIESFRVVRTDSVSSVSESGAVLTTTFGGRRLT